MSATPDVSLQGECPSLAGATGWLNSQPLTPAGLRGSVVLVDFWTYTCINWLRTEPYVRGWSEAYRDDGLVVVGVHTPEFSFEHEIERVRKATKARGIDYAVALDNDYAVWSAFENHYWPALYFLDAEGIIRDHHFGEGRYERSEHVIQRLLGVERELISVEGRGLEAEPDWEDLRTPETYLGYGRGEHFASPGRATPDEAHMYAAPERLALNHWALSGKWTVGREAAVSAEPGTRIAFRFHARDLHLVMGASADGSSARFRVLLDGQPPGLARGLDINERGEGVVSEPRLYQLVRQRDRITERTFEIVFLDTAVAAYVFTFG